MSHAPYFTLCSPNAAIGTSRKGTIYLSYDELTEIFGEANRVPSGEGKVECQWTIVFSNGNTATIYNYKNGPIYLEDDSVDLTKNTTWSIGGHTALAVLYIYRCVSSHIQGTGRKMGIAINDGEIDIMFDGLTKV